MNRILNDIPSKFNNLIFKSDSWLNVARIKTLEVTTPEGHVTGLRPAHEYLLRVVAINNVGASPPSPEVSVTTAHEPPAHHPNGVVATPISSSSLRITWQVSKEITGYVNLS